MSNYFCQWPGLKFLCSDGITTVDALEILSSCDHVLFFFGAGWHADTRRFAPLLSRFCADHHEAKRFVVVYMSRDTTEKEAMDSFMQFSACPPREVQNSEVGVENSADGTDKKERDVGTTSSSCKEASSTYTRGFYAVQFKDVDNVAAPLLYHFRVFSYPGIVVCRNLPAVTIEAPSPVVERDPTGKQRYKVTPRIVDRQCVPKLMTIAGRFMIEHRDPTGENFPWDKPDATMRAGRNALFVIVAVVVSVVLAILIPNMDVIFAKKKRIHR